MIDFNQITDYLSECVTDPVPKYIFQREILKAPMASPGYINAYDCMSRSKWYRELANEQWDDGSWGRFHSLDSKAPKQKFPTTESALRRARELSLSKDDAMVAKCIKGMEKYVCGDETWPDTVEKHKDNGKGHLFCRPFLTAANINMFDPENPVITPLRDVVAETLKSAFASGRFDEHYWDQKVKEYHVPSFTAPGTLYGAMLLQNANCMDDTLQRQWLHYIWDIKEGIYYVSSVPPAYKQFLEDKRFDQWFTILEILSGFSLFPDFMKSEILPHLLYEAERLLQGDVVLSHIKTGRYADSWRDKNKRKTDMVLRIARILVKC